MPGTALFETRPIAAAMDELRRRVERAVREAVESGDLPAPEGTPPSPEIEIPAHEEHGDFATNAALALARAMRRPPRQIAEAIAARLERGGRAGRALAPGLAVADVQVAGPGFINFFLAPSWLDAVVPAARAASWGRSDIGAGRRVVVEFVSANPTGPLNVVNARAAAYGDSLCRVLEATGHEVVREYYVNDAGNQFNRFAESVAIRCAELLEGATGLVIPEGGYPGEYVIDLAREAAERLGRELGGGPEAVLGLDPDTRRERLGRLALERVVEGQREVLERFRVQYDRWARESELRARGAAEEAFEALRRSGHTFEKDGAVWLRATDFGDGRDCVLRRRDGSFTYIVPDIAYHLEKLGRADVAIDLLGPDHHGYLAPMRAALAALGQDATRVEFLVSQMVHLVRGGDRLKMSKRQGDFVSMEEFLSEVDVDAARWFFVARSFVSPMEFDLDLANLRTSENPVYYVQYAHARIASLLARAEEAGHWPPPDGGGASGSTSGDTGEGPDSVRPAGETRYGEPSERALLRRLARFPEEVALAAEQRAPHRITAYAHELAAAYHVFYTECRVLDAESRETREARLLLSDAARNTLARCLSLVGVSAPERM